MRLLDLFCGAGGAAMGYSRAGFTEIIGVDIKPQPRYPFAFVQADALATLDDLVHALAAGLRRFDAIHASPPCQAFSRTRKILEGKGLDNLKGIELIVETRLALRRTGLPYVIENVPGSPLCNYHELCGTMFGLGVYRHRWFEMEPSPLLEFCHPRHCGGTGSHRGYSKGHPFVTVGGHNYNAPQGRAAMGIDWMTRDELNEAIPPAYTEWIGRQLLAALVLA